MRHDEWHPIPGFEGFYSVSAQGEIRRDARPVTLHTKRGGRLGYTIAIPGRRSSHWVHTLVAAVFFGPRPAGHEIHHKDGNPLNNAVENLEYLTPEVHAKRRRSYVGTGNPKSKLTEDYVRAIRAADVRKGRGITWDQLAALYGVSRHTIRAVRHREAWKHLT